MWRLPCSQQGCGRGAARQQATKLLESVDLGHRLTHRPGLLSGGQQQRVAIARALVHEPPLILADEPTAHLDYVQVEEIIRLIRNLASPGRTVVVSTHDERMLPLADQVIELSPRSAPPAKGPTRIDLDPGGELFAEGDRGDLVFLVNSGRDRDRARSTWWRRGAPRPVRCG